MNKFVSTITAAFAIFCVLSSMAYNVYAVDLTQKGSIIVVVEYDGKPLAGMDVELCQIADAIEVNNIIKFTLTSGFTGSSVTDADLTDLSAARNAALSATLNAYASNNNIPRMSNTTDSNGRALFSDLSAGLYLVTQKNPLVVIESGSRIEYVMQSFIISMPYPDVDGISFSVAVRPKCEADTTRIPTSPPPGPTSSPRSNPDPPSEIPPTQGDTPSEVQGVSQDTPPQGAPAPVQQTPVEQTTTVNEQQTPEGQPEVPGETVVPEEPPKGNLPQTGILRWPVVALSASGTTMLLIGMLILRKNKDSNE